MAEKPILFSGPMVRAILNTKIGSWPAEPIDPSLPYKWQTRRCHKKPRYAVGDHAWVRETWGIFDADTFGDAYAIAYRADDYGDKVGEAYWPEVPREYQGRYCMNGADGTCRADEKWRPSIHMPRWATRLWVEIMNVRIQHIQTINTLDIIAEATPGDPADAWTWAERFRALWDSLNAKRGYPYATNPHVAVYEFRRIA